MAASAQPGASRPRVLLVDDDVAFLRVFSAGLERSGFDVVTAETFQEALDRAGEPGPPLDVLIADINLPDGWGARLALALAPLQPQAKVVYISGYAATDPILKEGIEDHMVFLGKPFEVEELADKVRAVLAG